MNLSGLPPHLADGVHFECVDCGACCGGAPGRVRLRPGEFARIAAYLGADPSALAPRVLRREPDGAEGLREEPNGDCVFFQEGRCSIHAVKPAQCRLYPFWFRNTRSREAWERTAAECPGIGRGPPVRPEEILARVREDLEAP